MFLWRMITGQPDLHPPFLDCVQEGNVELVKEHLSRGEKDASDRFLYLQGNNTLSRSLVAFIMLVCMDTLR